MKTMVLPMVMLIISCYTGYGQAQRDNRFYFWPEDSLTHKYNFRGTVFLRGFYEQTIYKAAKAFVMNHFQNEDERILYTNDTISTIACRGIYPIAVEPLGEKGTGYVSFKLTLECFDNGFLYSITDFEHASYKLDGAVGGPLERTKAISGGIALPNRYWNEVKEKCYYNIQLTIEQLKEFMDKHVKAPVS
jgi:hypothetical protein